MAKKARDKKITFLSPSFRDFLVCRNNGNRPFLESFIAEPENVSSESLGTLFGFFEITDHSDDSAYVVNYLFSVLKKEFFLRPGRGAIESFESALHKANLALSKLASSENVKWIGHLDSVCGVIEKNNLHVSSAGRPGALLLRNESLTDLTEGAEAQAEPNPIKTFQDVLSGRLEEGDKVIIANAGIFDIFSREEIRRSGLKFSREEFLRFLHTALVNELESAAVIVIDIDRKEESLPETSDADIPVNAFSQASFERTAEPQEAPLDQLAISGEEKASIKEKVAEIRKEIVDQKSGHIYIKEEANEAPDSDRNESARYAERLSGFGQVLSDGLEKCGRWLKAAMAESGASASKAFRRFVPGTHKIADEKSGIGTDPGTDMETAETGSVPAANLAGKAKARAFAKETFASVSDRSEKAFRAVATTSAAVSRSAAARTAAWSIDFFRWARRFSRVTAYRSAILFRKTSRKLRQEYRRLKDSKPAPRASVSRPEKSIREKASIDNFSSFARERNRSENREKRLGYSARKRMMPDFSKLKRIAGKLTYHQKLYLALAILAFFLVPYWIVRIENRNARNEKAATAPSDAPTAETAMLPLKDDKNVVRVSEITKDYSGQGILSVIMTKNGPFAVSSDEIYDLNGKSGIALPESFQDPDLAVPMDDLGLIFLLKNGKLSAYSESNGKLQDNDASLENPKYIRALGTYLTYLYVLDPKDSQIYRYPRAEGGFGERTSWLKDGIDLSQAKDMAVSDSIFVLDGDGIAKFFRGKEQPFEPETTATPVVPDRIFADENSNLYVLDRKNSRIVEYASDGKIISQFYAPAIEEADAFGVDSANGRIYLSNGTSVSSFGM